ncbi:laccase [Dendrothele bispora CBS 962.96]|uniref:Laccase n=1 Tax=Dendrothele bispora (strain CBS 962.96) TaxID=1314807 RepID=A0A4S8LRA2_DENBC|nr:laccase [Dendrothele bispora CBS 962.96]
MVLSASYLLLALSLSALTSAADVNYVFNIDNAIVAPDGFNRAGVIVNDVYPGTLIQASKNDVLHITANNNLTDASMRRSLSIHWHGLFQMKTASEDGPAFVNQCPISPQHSYTYDIPLNGQAGTFWYHSHLSSQYVDGLRGALVVYDPEDPHLSLYDVDDENTVITLADWYHLPGIGIEEKYLHESPFHEPVPDSGLVNGHGRYEGGPNTPWARIDVEAGKRYRFRVVNIAGYAAFTFSIDDHQLTVIEADGISHEPVTVDGFEILVGQRYSAVLHADQPVDNYWISAPMELQHSADNDNLDTDNVYAVLHYIGAPDADPNGKPKNLAAVATITETDPSVAAKSGGLDLLDESELVPLFNPEAPGGSAPADRVIDLNFQRDQDTGELEWTINGIKYESPDLPTLLNIMSNGFTNENQFTTQEHTFVLKRDEIVELQIHGSANGHKHPFHLHGHVFSVVQGMKGNANYANPPQRDVVGVGGSTVIIRFKADNPGPWFLHCHIDWHLVAGLAVVFAEDPESQREGPKSQVIKQEWLDLCPIYQALPSELQ